MFSLKGFSQERIAQNFKRYPVKTINFEQGLLNNASTNIITDTLGFTWVSTLTGMQRYNGYKLETVNPVVGSDRIFINARVYFLGLKSGMIWIGYKKGILEYNPFTNTFKKIISHTEIDGLDYPIIPLAETNRGVFCIQYKKGVLLFSEKGKMLQEISGPNQFSENIFANQKNVAFNQYSVNQQYIFLYDGMNEILQLNLLTYHSKTYKTPVLNNLCSDDDYLYLISGDRFFNISIGNKEKNYSSSLKLLAGENINSYTLSIIGKNKILIGLNNQVYEFNNRCQYVNTLSTLNKNPIAALGFIRVIYEDRFNRIWILTNDDIKRIQFVEIPFEHFIYPNEKNNFVRSLYYDEEKDILLSGCFKGGMQLYDSSGHALWKNSLLTNTFTDIINIEKLSENHYLIITLNKGWYVLRLPGKTAELLQMPSNLDKDFSITWMSYANNLQRLDEQTILITTHKNVLRCIFKNDVLVSAKPMVDTNKIAGYINCFIYTSGKQLWVATSSGMYKIDADQKIYSIKIPGNYSVRCYAEDAQQNIWVGTDKGLFVFNSLGKLLKTTTQATGLLNDCIYAIEPIKNNEAVYASSNLGLSYVPFSGNIINYLKESGLQENEFNNGASLITLSGKYFFGGVNGISAFYSNALANVKDTPVLNITKLIINDSTFNPSSVFQNNIMKLKYDQKHIQFDFVALGLFNANEYEYKYRLKGFEANWQTTHNPTEIKYFLEPGNYEFEISCSPPFSSGNVFYKTFNLIISPPWWQTWWFKLIMLVAFAGFIILFVQQILKRKYQKKLREFELQQYIQQERRRISRDLHDNLGAYAAAIAANVANIKNADEQENSLPEQRHTISLRQLKDNSQAIINQLNDTIWALNKEAISLTAVSDRFKVFLHKIQLNYPRIKISVNESILKDAQFSPANALHLFRILQEAVNNALRHSECSNVIIHFSGNDTWSISVQDDGKGITFTGMSPIQGNGLKNIQNRSDEAGWKVSWANDQTGGTTFSVSNNIN